MLVSMDGDSHAQASRQVTEHFETKVVVARGFVGHEHISPLSGQSRHVACIDGGLMFDVRPISPTCADWRRTRMIFSIPIHRADIHPLFWVRIPNRTPKNAAQPRHLDAVGEPHNAAVQISSRQLAVGDSFPQVAAVGVVVSVNEPHPVGNLCQFYIERTFQFKIAQDHNRAVRELLGGLKDVRELAVGVSTKEGIGSGGHGHFALSMTQMPAAKMT